MYDGTGNIAAIGTDAFTYDRYGRLVSGSLRSALAPARSALGLTALAYQQPALGPGSVIFANDVMELRGGVQ